MYVIRYSTDSHDGPGILDGKIVGCAPQNAVAILIPGALWESSGSIECVKLETSDNIGIGHSSNNDWPKLILPVLWPQ
jgi:hypothetical protein